MTISLTGAARRCRWFGGDTMSPAAPRRRWNCSTCANMFWSAIWRHRLLVMAIVAVTLALGVLALFLVDLTFRVLASVEIEDQAVEGPRTQDWAASLVR